MGGMSATHRREIKSLGITGDTHRRQRVKLELFAKIKSRIQAETKTVSKFNNVLNSDHRQKKVGASFARW